MNSCILCIFVLIQEPRLLEVVGYILYTLLQIEYFCFVCMYIVVSMHGV